MGHFDIVADSSFKKTADGRVIFQPWGVYGLGYEVPTKEIYDEIRSFVSHFTLGGILLGILGVMFGWLSLLLVLSGICVAYRVRIRFLTRGLAEVEQPGLLTERLKGDHRRHAAATSFTKLWLLQIGAVFFLVVSIAMLLSHTEAIGDLGLVFLIALFGFCVVVGGYMIWVKHGLAGKPDPFDLP